MGMVRCSMCGGRGFQGGAGTGEPKQACEACSGTGEKESTTPTLDDVGNFLGKVAKEAKEKYFGKG